MGSEDHIMQPLNLFCYVRVHGTELTCPHCPPSTMVGWFLVFLVSVLVSQWMERGGGGLLCHVWVGSHLSHHQSGKGAWTSESLLVEVPEGAVYTV